MSSQLSWTIIRQFSNRNMLGYTFLEVSRAFLEKNCVHLARILAEMVDKGMLYRIPWDKFHIIPFNADSETYVPDGYQVAK